MVWKWFLLYYDDNNFAVPSQLWNYSSGVLCLLYCVANNKTGGGWKEKGGSMLALEIKRGGYNSLHTTVLSSIPCIGC